MRSVRIIALATLMAGSLGGQSVHASSSEDVYSFFANDRARNAAATSTAPSAAKAAAAVKDRVAGENADTAAAAAPAAVGKEKPQRRRTVRKQPAGAAPATIAPPHLAARAAGRASRTVAAGKPLGYHTASRERYRGLIARHAAANGLPFALGDAVVRVESRYRPQVSNAGALGLMQIKHTTARGLGYRGSAGGLLDPETNIRYGMKYLGQAYRLAGGDTCGTVMRYQSGHYAKRINRANLAYCAKVRTIIASLGTELAVAETAAARGATRVE